MSVVSSSSWELTPRGRMLAGLSALAVCGAWVTGDRHATLAASLLLAPILVDRLWKGWGLPHLQVLVGERRTWAGSPFLETIRLINPSRRRTVRDVYLVEDRIGTRGQGAYVEALTPGATARVQLPSRCRRRGLYTKRTFRCETSFPLGILTQRIDILCVVPLVAEPSRARLPAHVLHSIEAGTEDSAVEDRGGGEFWSLRDYRYGDDFRGVHALRSAATGTLVSVVSRGRDEDLPCVVLDLRRPPARPAHNSDTQFEWSLSAAATLTDHFGGAGRAFTCMVLAAQHQTFEVAAPADAEDLLDFLTQARPSRHTLVDPATLEKLASFDRCIWIPAGGHPARDERAALRAVDLLSPDQEAE